MRRRAHAGVKPNAAHLALGRLSREHEATTIVTQNVDCLHEAAGTARLIHMHGEAMKSLCAHCNARGPWIGDMSVATVCSACGKAGGMRPDVVWFGEMPYHMETIGKLLLRVTSSSPSVRAAMSIPRPDLSPPPRTPVRIPLN